MARFRSNNPEPERREPSPGPGVSIPTDSVAIDLPIGDPTTGHQPHHLNCQLYTPAARAGAARLLDGLRRAKVVRRDTGREIDNFGDAVRYLLEEYEAAASATE